MRPVVYWFWIQGFNQLIASPSLLFEAGLRLRVFGQFSVVVDPGFSLSFIGLSLSINCGLMFGVRLFYFS